MAVDTFICSIASPNTLDKSRSSRNLSVEVFLSLLLLNLQCKPRSQNALKSANKKEVENKNQYCWKCKERYGKDREARSNNFPHPCLGHSISIAYSSHCDLGEKTKFSTIFFFKMSHHSPPQSISIAIEVCFPSWSFGILLTEIHEVAGEDETKKPNVESGDQLLHLGNKNEVNREYNF